MFASPLQEEAWTHDILLSLWELMRTLGCIFQRILRGSRGTVNCYPLLNALYFEASGGRKLRPEYDDTAYVIMSLRVSTGELSHVKAQQAQLLSYQCLPQCEGNGWA